MKPSHQALLVDLLHVATCSSLRHTPVELTFYTHDADSIALRISKQERHRLEGSSRQHSLSSSQQSVCAPIPLARYAHAHAHKTATLDGATRAAAVRRDAPATPVCIGEAPVPDLRTSWGERTEDGRASRGPSWYSCQPKSKTLESCLVSCTRH